jgi:L-glyceraldehyde 3-phosphate reductase
MTYRRCGRSGLDLSAISLGLHRTFAAERPAEIRQAVLLRAFERGVTSFDLANIYGPPVGHAEEFFGAIYRSQLASHRDEIVIATKAGVPMWDPPYGGGLGGGSRKHLISAAEASLRRLGLDYVDIFYHHRFDPTTPLEETASALADLVRHGKALYIGVSNYPGAQTAILSRLLAEQGVRLLVAQERYNLLDRRIEVGPVSTLSILADQGIGLAVYSPLDSGRLTDRYLAGIPEGSRATTHAEMGARVTEEYVDVARQLNVYAEERGQKLAQLAVAWLLRHPVVATALVGASSVAQLDATLDGLDQPQLSAAEFTAIEDLIAQHPHIMFA